MDWHYFRQIIKIFFGICLLIFSFGLFLMNLFVFSGGFDVSLLLLNLLLFFGGLLCTVFGISQLPAERK